MAALAEVSAVFVNGFDFGTTEEALQSHMGAAGTVLSVAMQKGSAVVTYATPAEAQLAVSSLNKSTVPGNTRFIDVQLDKKSMPPNSADKGGGSPKVHVKGFDFGTTDEQFMAHMSQVGAVVDVKWVSKGSANVVYSSVDEATTAIKQLHRTTIQGNSRFIDVIPGGDRAADANRMKRGAPTLWGGKGGGWWFAPWGGKGKGGGKGRKGGKNRDHSDEDPAGAGRVFVRGFDFGTTDEQLLGHMAQAGPIHAVHWVSKGNAVVVYSNKASATIACSSLDNTTIAGNSRFIHVCPRD